MLSLKYIFLVLMLLSLSLAAQSDSSESNRLDSLKLALSLHPADSTRIQLFTQISFEIAPIDPGLALGYADSAISLGHKKANRAALAEALSARGNALSRAGKPDSAQAAFNKSEKIYRDLHSLKGLSGVLNQSARAYYRDKNNDLAISRFKQAAAYFDSTGKVLNRGRALNNIGLAYWNLGNYEPALKFYKQAFFLFSKLGDSYWMGLLANNIGTVYWGIGSYNLALKQFHQALQLRKQNDDFHGLILTLNNIGLIYQEWNKYDRALDYHLRALAISDSISDTFGKAYSQINLGSYYSHNEKPDIALNYFMEARGNYASENKRIGESLALNHIGKVYFTKKQYAESQKYFEKSLELGKQAKNENRVAIALASIAETQLMRGQLSRSIKTAQASLNISKEHDYRQLYSKNYFTISKAYEKQGNYQQSLLAFKQGDAWQDSLFNEQKMSEFSDLQVRFHLADIDRENQLLRQDNDIQKLNVQSEQKLRNYLLLIALLALAVIVLFYLRNKSSGKANALLQKQNDEIRVINTEKEKLIRELQAAIENVSKLEGLLPICARCKKIRNDAGKWSEVEEYVQMHSEAEFSHGLCPDCAQGYLDTLG